MTKDRYMMETITEIMISMTTMKMTMTTNYEFFFPCHWLCGLLCLVRYNAIQSGICLLTFRGKIMPQPSGYKSKQNVETVPLVPTLGLRFSLEDVRIELVRSFCKLYPEYADCHTRPQLSSAIFFSWATEIFIAHCLYHKTISLCSVASVLLIKFCYSLFLS
jgi:hypothetical protein